MLHKTERFIIINNLRVYPKSYLKMIRTYTDEKRIIMRQHAFLGRMVFYFVIIFAWTASAIIIMTPVFANSQNIQNNISLNKYASMYSLPSACTLGQLDISTKMYLLIFVVQCIHLINGAYYVGKLK